MRSTPALLVASLALHVTGGVALASIEVHSPPAPVVVEMRTVVRPARPAEPPPPTPPPPEPTAPARPAAPAPAPTAAPPPSFGVALSGVSGGPGGLAVPVGRPDGARSESRALAAVAPPECPEGDTKAKAVSVPRPTYPDEARAAGVEGKVRVELSVDATGAVVGAKVLEGLGNGLDEAAVAAVNAARFEPATRCGRAVASTFVVAIRFAL